MQLKRPPRGMVAVASRCSCGWPLVVRTTPRLPDGTPFPTLYYLTCPRLGGAVSTLETQGMMRVLDAELTADPDLAAAYRRAHEAYLLDRDGEVGDRDGEVGDRDGEVGDRDGEVGDRDGGVGDRDGGVGHRGVSAGGMPDRVKCLHVLVAHSLAVGRGVNPLGDRVVDALAAAGIPRETEPTCSVRLQLGPL